MAGNRGSVGHSGRARLRLQYFSVDAIQIRMHEEYRTSQKRVLEHRTVGVVVRAGPLVGNGEAYTMQPDACTEELLAAASRVRGPLIWELDAILDSVQSLQARAALDLAMHDLYGKLCELPAARWLSIPDREVPTAVSFGIRPVPEVVERAVHWVQHGIRFVKLKVEAETPLSLIEEVRRAVGPNVGIWIDANQSWSLARLRDAKSTLEREKVLFVEQPFARDDLELHAEARRECGVPIFLDESIQRMSDLLRAISLGAADGINVKLSKCGGLRACVDLMRVAKAAKLELLVGCFFESALSLTAASHLQGYADYLDLDASLYLSSTPSWDGAILSGGYYRPPSRHGLGATRIAGGGGEGTQRP